MIEAVAAIAGLLGMLGGLYAGVRIGAASVVLPEDVHTRDTLPEITPEFLDYLESGRRS